VLQKSRYGTKRDIFVWAAVGCIVLRILCILLIVQLPSSLAGFWVVLFIALQLAALVFAVIGTYYWAKYKARSEAFLLLGFFAPLSWIVMAYLIDKWPAEQIPETQSSAMTGYSDHGETL
jgi:hypothetical protein